MKHSKIVGWGIVTTILVAFFVGFFGLENTDGLMTFDGIALGIFVVWASVLLIRYKA